MAGWVKKTVPIIAPDQIFDYRQGEDLRWKIKKITSAGACQGLSIFWVIKKANGVDFLTWLGPPKSASSHGKDSPKMGKEMDDVVRVMQQQDKIFALPHGSRALNMKWARDRIAQAERGGGSTKLQVQGNLSLLQGATPQQIAANVTSLNGLVFFGFHGNIGDGGSAGGHAVAAYVQTPTVDFFDPNLGEYHFRNRQSFHTWFETTLMQQTYGVNILNSAEIQHFM